jgi:hypothetical protein
MSLLDEDFSRKSFSELKQANLSSRLHDQQKIKTYGFAAVETKQKIGIALTIDNEDMTVIIRLVLSKNLFSTAAPYLFFC